MAEAAPARLALGIDLGTSAVKVVVIDEPGHVLGAGSGDFPTHGEEPGAAEQEPADWLEALVRAMRALDAQLVARHPAWRAGVGAIGLAGQLPTLVCVGQEKPLGRAITWKDARADAWASSAIDAERRRTLYASTGMPIDGRYLGPMLRHHRAGALGAIRTVLSAKDYLCYALTGVRVTDPSTAAGYGAFDLAHEVFTDALCGLWQLPRALLPDVRPAHALAAPLSAGGAHLLGLAPGIPVAVGAADSVAGAYALAGLREGVACVAMGSSTIILDATRKRHFDRAARYLLTPHVEPGWYGREMDLLATGTGHRWVSDLFGWDEGELDDQAARSEPGARGLHFAPYLAGGEQGALWNPALRGAIHGLTLQHGPADIARAFLEGVYFEIRRCIEVLAEESAVEAVVVSGGITASASSLQLLADVLQRPVLPARAVSAAAQGAAQGAQALWGAAARQDAAPGVLGPAVPPGSGSECYGALYAAYRACVD